MHTAAQFGQVDVAASDLTSNFIYSYDQCASMRIGPEKKSHGPLCDLMYSVPRKWSDTVFSAVNGWSICRSMDDNIPCHHDNLTVHGHEGHIHGTASQCMLTAWLMDHGINPHNFMRFPRNKVSFTVARAEDEPEAVEKKRADEEAKRLVMEAKKMQEEAETKLKQVEAREKAVQNEARQLEAVKVHDKQEAEGRREGAEQKEKLAQARRAEEAKVTYL